MGEHVIEIKNVWKSYGKKQAIRGMDLQLHTNQMIGLIGANGSGKTTLFKMCVGLEDITEGEIQILGKNPRRDVSVCSEMIYSMHDVPVAPSEKMKQILRYYEIAFPNFDMEFAGKLMELFELSLKKSCSQLSQGMKSVFHLICAMASRCRVTLLDEPFIGVDIEKRKMAREILLRDYMEHPRTFVISSHNLAEMEGVLSEMVLIHEGKLIFYQDMDTVRGMLFRASGSARELEKWMEGLPSGQIVRRETGQLGDSLILRGSPESDLAKGARQAGLELSAVGPEDVCVYLTASDRARELEDLW